MKFEDIPDSIRRVVYIAVGAIALFTYHDQFITKAHASESARIQWISNVEAELRSVKRSRRMVKDPEILKEIDEDIEALEEKLKCLRTADEDKVKFC